MTVYFAKPYLKELYETMRTNDKKHRFQPSIVKRYVKVINLMVAANNVLQLNQYGSLHYEHLTGDKKGLSSVRVNDQYRIEFEEKIDGDETVATICNIIELSNHYD